jgi:hypothetical protein
MTRIRRAQIELRGAPLSPERATQIARRALGLAASAAPAGDAAVQLGRVSLTVRVPSGASDAAVAERVAAALARRLAGRES